MKLQHLTKGRTETVAVDPPTLNVINERSAARKKLDWLSGRRDVLCVRAIKLGSSMSPRQERVEESLPFKAIVMHMATDEQVPAVMNGSETEPLLCLCCGCCDQRCAWHHRA